MRSVHILGRRSAHVAAMATAAAAAMLVVSACGSSTAAGTSPAGSSVSPAAASSGSGAAASGGAAVISTTKGPEGTFLVGPSGKTVYLWVADKSTSSTCSAACAAAWPPVTTKGAPTASGSAVAKDLGTTKRSDGAEQVTYDGHPLYYYAGDSAPGQTNGQNSDQFGAKWWLVSPAGSAITASAPAGGGAAPTSATAPSSSAKGGGESWG